METDLWNLLADDLKTFESPLNSASPLSPQAWTQAAPEHTAASPASSQFTASRRNSQIPDSRQSAPSSRRSSQSGYNAPWAMSSTPKPYARPQSATTQPQRSSLKMRSNGLHSSASATSLTHMATQAAEFSPSSYDSQNGSEWPHYPNLSTTPILSTSFDSVAASSVDTPGHDLGSFTQITPTNSAPKEHSIFTLHGSNERLNGLGDSLTVPQSSYSTHSSPHPALSNSSPSAGSTHSPAEGLPPELLDACKPNDFSSGYPFLSMSAPTTSYMNVSAAQNAKQKIDNLTWALMSLRLARNSHDRLLAQQALKEHFKVDDISQLEAELQRHSIPIPQPVENGVRGRQPRSSSKSAGHTPPAEDETGNMDWRAQSHSRPRMASETFAEMDWRGQSRSRSRAPQLRLDTQVGVLPPSAQTAPPDLASLPDLQSLASSSLSSSRPSTSQTPMMPTYGAPVTSTFDIPQSSALRSNARTEGEMAVPLASVPQQQLYIPPMLNPQQPTLTQTLYSQPQPQPQPQNQSYAMPPQSSSASSSSTYRSAIPPELLPYFTNSNHNFTPAPQTQNQYATTSQQPHSAVASSSMYPFAFHHYDSFPTRMAGSVPGLYDETAPIQNHHADFGYLPKLVRKTSFDAAYPAALALKAQRQHEEATKSPPNESMPAPRAKSRQRASIAVPQTSVVSQLYASNQAASPNQLSNLAAQVRANVSNLTQPQALEALARLQTAQVIQALQTKANGDLSSTSNLDPKLLNMQPLPSVPFPSTSISPQMLSQPTLSSSIDPYAMSTNFAAPLPVASPSVIAPVSPIEPIAKEKKKRFTATPSNLKQNIKPDPPPIAQPAPRNSISSPKKKSRALSEVTAADIAVPSAVEKEDEVEDEPSPAESEPVAPSKIPGAKKDETDICCINCKTTNTPLWRRDEQGRPLCNACQLFRKLHGSDRPVSLHTGIVKKRNRSRLTKDPIPKKVFTSSTRPGARRNSLSNASSPTETSGPYPIRRRGGAAE